MSLSARQIFSLFDGYRLSFKNHCQFFNFFEKEIRCQTNFFPPYFTIPTQNEKEPKNLGIASSSQRLFNMGEGPGDLGSGVQFYKICKSPISMESKIAWHHFSFLTVAASRIVHNRILLPVKYKIYPPFDSKTWKSKSCIRPFWYFECFLRL